MDKEPNKNTGTEHTEIAETEKADQPSQTRVERHRNYGKKTRGRTGWKIIFFVCLGIVLYLFMGAFVTAREIYHPAQTATTQSKDSHTITRLEPVSILLIGRDSGNRRTTGEMNTDTLILLTMNPCQRSGKMYSIPRDTYSALIGTKINAAYSLAGDKVEGSMQAVEDLLGVPVNYYVLVDMTGFVNVIDAIGGVTVDNPFYFTQSGYKYPKGRIRLETGEKALNYVRMRKQDPEGDFGRAKRQQQVIGAVMDELGPLSLLKNYHRILPVVSDNVDTNLSFNNLLGLFIAYLPPQSRIEHKVLIGTSDISTGTYYNILSDEQRQKIHHQLARHLELTD